jgi:hypothetical protein
MRQVFDLPAGQGAQIHRLLDNIDFLVYQRMGKGFILYLI